MSFGERLRELIMQHGLTQRELAQQLNLAPSTLGSYVQGVREPDFTTLKSIADYFGVSTDYLLNHPVSSATSNKEAELLQIFHSLTPQQQDICLEQCRVLLQLRLNQ